MSTYDTLALFGCLALILGAIISMAGAFSERGWIIAVGFLVLAVGVGFFVGGLFVTRVTS